MPRMCAGKAVYIGLSEVNSDILRKAHAIHPITCVEQVRRAPGGPRRGAQPGDSTAGPGVQLRAHISPLSGRLRS